MIIDNFFELIKVLLKAVYECLDMFTDLNRITVKSIIVNPLCRLVFIGFVCLWLLVLVVIHRQTIKECLLMYFNDIKIYKSELKQYDDITFKLFRNDGEGYCLKDFLPVTKDRIKWFKIVTVARRTTKTETKYNCK